MSRNAKVVTTFGLLALVALVGLWLRLDGSGRSVRPGSEGTHHQDSVPQEQPIELPSAPKLPREVVPTQATAPVAEKARSMHLLVLRAEDDRPVPGVSIQAYEDGAKESQAVLGTTGEDGRCLIRVADAATSVRLRVEKEGYFHLNAYYERRDELTLRLTSTATLVGRVLAADTGAPVPGARIRMPHNFCKRCEPDVVLADGLGRYELANVPRLQDATFLLDAEGFASQWRRFELREDVPVIEVDFHIERGTEIFGRVEDYTTGAGIPNAKVGDIEADATGTFRGRVLPEEGRSKVHLRVEALGHCMLSGALDPEQAASALVFRLPRGAIVEGTVTDGHGEPVAAALVRLDIDHRARARAARHPESSQIDVPEGWRLDPEGHHSTTRTDEQGRYRIANAVPASENMNLSVFADGHSRKSHAIERLRGPGESLWVDVVLGEPKSEVKVSGTVHLNGQSLRTAQGRVHWKGPSREGDGIIHTGSFYTDVEPGEVAFSLEIEGLPTATEGVEFTLQLGLTAKIDHVVELSLPTRPIAGRVTFEDGGAAPRVAIDASFPLVDPGKGYWDRLHVSNKTAEDGSFTLDVPDVTDSYRVVAKLDEDEQSIEGVRAGTSGINLVLARSGVLQFRFRDAQTDEILPSRNFELGWRRPAEERFHSLHLGWALAPDPDGWFEKRLPSGRLDLRVREDDQPKYVSTSVEDVLIRPNEPTRVEFMMVPGRSMELYLAEDQRPFSAKHAVLLVEADLWEGVQHRSEGNSWDGGALGSEITNRFVQFDSEGRAMIYGLSSGRFRFKVFPGDIAIEPEFVEVGESAPGKVTLRWRELK